MGVAQSLSYYIARRPEDGPSLYTTWVCMLVPLSLVALGITELLSPRSSRTTGSEAISIGRWFMVTILAVVGLELNYGLLLGKQDFFVYNVAPLRADDGHHREPLVALWALGDLTVETTLITTTSATVGSSWRWA